MLSLAELDQAVSWLPTLNTIVRQTQVILCKRQLSCGSSLIRNGSGELFEDGGKGVHGEVAGVD